jgi:aldose sugar dehydrogenase
MLRIFTASFLAAASVIAQNPPSGFSYQAIVTASNMERGCTMAFAPDGRLFVCDRINGNVRVIRNGTLEPQPWHTVTMNPPPAGEAGLVGIAIDPQFLSNGYVYLYYTDMAAGENRIARVRDVNGQGTGFTVLSPNGAIPIHPFLIHNGGRMVFGQDGKLYVAVGDTENNSLPQDPNSWAGKVLRFNAPDLSIPADNPLAGSPVYTLGHRNIFGIAMQPGSGWLVVSENGFLVGDEFNRLVPGGNYGWPFHEGPNPSTTPYINPLRTLPVQPALTGLTFYQGDNYPGFRNQLFTCHWIGGQIRRLTLDAAGTTVVADAGFDQLGWAFDAAMGPDGNLWVLHGNASSFGANRIGRYTHSSAPIPGIHLMAVSGRALGGSMTMGITANNGDLVLPWLGLSRLVPPTPSPVGPIGASIDVQLPLQFVVADNRCYVGIALPRVTELIGLPLHAQALRIQGSSFAMDVTNTYSYTLQ